jgi:hypothetical protein
MAASCAQDCACRITHTTAAYSRLLVLQYIAIRSYITIAALQHYADQHRIHAFTQLAISTGYCILALLEGSLHATAQTSK